MKYAYAANGGVRYVATKKTNMYISSIFIARCAMSTGSSVDASFFKTLLTAPSPRLIKLSNISK